MNWFTSNWEKIIGLFLSVIVAGLIGFFSAIISMKGEVSQLKTEVAQLRVELDKAITPRLDVVNSHAEKIAILEKTLIVLSTNTEQLKGHTETLSRQTNSMLLFQWQKGANPSQP